MSDWIHIDWVLVLIVAVLFGCLMFCIGFLDLVFDVREDNKIDRQIKKEDKISDSSGINKQTLWNKAGTSDHITRADAGVRQPKDNSGIQALNEGYLGVTTTFTLGEELRHGDKVHL